MRWMTQTVGPLLAVMALIACGGGQNRDAGSGPTWTTLHDAIPPTATYAMVSSWDSETAEAQDARLRGALNAFVQLTAVARFWMQQNVTAESGLTNFAMPDPFRAARERLGVDLNAPDASASLGIALEGEFAIFSTAIDPVLILPMSDPSAMRQAMRHMADSPGTNTSSMRIARMPMTRYDFGGTSSIDVGVFDNFAVIRFNTGLLNAETTDANLANALRGFAIGARLIDTPGPASVLARSPEGTRLERFSFARTETLDILTLAVSANAARTYLSPEHEEMCAISGDRFLATIPWVAEAAFSDPSMEGTHHQLSVVHFSHGGSDRVRPLITSGIDDASMYTDEAALFFSGGANLRGLLDAIQAPPDAHTCPNIAAIPGAMARLREENRRLINYNLRYFNGTITGALLDFRMLGFIPSATGTVMIGTNDPPGLNDQVQRRLRQMAGRGAVNPTASMPTIVYNVLGQEVTIVTATDRVVIAAGNVGTSRLHHLSNAPINQEGLPFLRVDWLGEAAQPILDRLIEYDADTQAFTDGYGTFMIDALNYLKRVVHVNINGQFDGQEIVVRWHAHVDP